MTSKSDQRTVAPGLAALAALLAVVLVASACSSSKKSSASSSSPNTVNVKNFSFQPGSLTVPVGTKVTWKFDDSAQHALKANDSSFTSNPLSSGQTYSFTFSKAGTYSYICSIHTYMKGTVVVQ
jgi:plastocyanin